MHNEAGVLYPHYAKTPAQLVQSPDHTGDTDVVIMPQDYTLGLEHPKCRRAVGKNVREGVRPIHEDEVHLPFES
jgi:hypothetical protein